MKNLLILILTIMVSNTVLQAQSKTQKTETFKVYGNCEMCQETIETALKKKDGIISKSWDIKSKMLTVSYDSSKVTLTQIKQKLADVGYDTDEIRAKSEVYNKLHTCCQYERPNSVKK